MPVKCLRCGESLKPEMEACPKCGSRDREVAVEDSIKAWEMIEIRQKAEGYHRFKKYSKHGEKISKTGKSARVILVVDKEARRKYHRVEEQNEKGEWVVVHEEDKAL
jgi:uncharacterized OB-fold protein